MKATASSNLAYQLRRLEADINLWISLSNRMTTETESPNKHVNVLRSEAKRHVGA